MPQRKTFNKILEDVKNIKMTSLLFLVPKATWLAFWVFRFLPQVSNFLIIFYTQRVHLNVSFTISFLMLSSLVSCSFLSLFIIYIYIYRGVNTLFVLIFWGHFYFGHYIFILPFLVSNPINACDFSLFRHSTNRKSQRGKRSALLTQ